MSTAKPSLELLRDLSDEHVLAALMTQPRLTRAELAARTGISKPTVGESVRRLVEAGVVVDTGERTTGRGRIGSYYALSADVGTALAVSVSPEGVVAELVDAHANVSARATEPVARPASPAALTTALRQAVARVQAQDPTATRLGVVSAADPVDRRTGHLVHLVDSPFLVGELDPVDLLAPFVDGPVVVDNDVNWAARAERTAAPEGTLDDFAYLFLSEGLGCAVISDGEVRLGHSGLTGEIAHLVTTGPDGRACAFIEVFARLGLRHPESTAIDVPALIGAVEDRGSQSAHTRSALGAAIGGVLSALVALADPSVVIVGGSWGAHPLILDAVRTYSLTLPRAPLLQPASITAQAPLAGARERAVSALRASITNYRQARG